MFKEISVKTLKENVFDLIGNQWMLVTAGDREQANTMTASWGGLGIMWGKNVAYIVIRPQRYTKEFIDRKQTLTLTFYQEDYKKTLSYLGSVSGKNENKIEKSGLTLDYLDDTPYFSEAKLVLKVKKLYAQPMEEESILEKEIVEKWYPAKDYHTMYICEIEQVLVKEGTES